MVGQWAGFIGVAGSQHGILHFLPGNRAVFHQNIDAHLTGGRAVGQHIGNVIAHGFSLGNVAAFRPRGGIVVLTLAQLLVELVIGGGIAAAAALGQVGAAGVVVEHIHNSGDLTCKVTVSRRAGSHALGCHIAVGLPGCNVAVLHGSPEHILPIAHARTFRDQHGAGLRLADIEPHSHGGGGRGRARMLVEQLAQGIKVRALGAARYVLVSRMVQIHPFLQNDACDPRNKNALRAAGLGAVADNSLIGIYQRSLQPGRVGVHELIQGVSTHLGYSPPRLG